MYVFKIFAKIIIIIDFFIICNQKSIKFYSDSSTPFLGTETNNA